MRKSTLLTLAVAMVTFAPAIAVRADSNAVTVEFVELAQQDGNAVLVVKLTNGGATPVTSLTFSCWTEERSKIGEGDATGSRYMAFNTGGVKWAGDLAVGQTVTAEGVIDDMPADMVPMFSDQSFDCGAS